MVTVYIMFLCYSTVVFTESIICVKFGLQLFKKTEVVYVALWLTIEVRGKQFKKFKL